MSRPKKSQEQLEEMRGKILDAAYELLLEKGPSGITARAIADRLGMAHMALFTYFPNQGTIIQDLADREMGMLYAQQAVFAQRAEREDIVQVVHDALAFYPNFEKQNPRIFYLALALPLSEAGDPVQAQARLQSSVQYLARLIQIGIERGAFERRDPFLAAGTAISLVISPLILYYGGRIPSIELRDRIVQEALIAAMRYLKRQAQSTS